MKVYKTKTEHLIPFRCAQCMTLTQMPYTDDSLTLFYCSINCTILAATEYKFRNAPNINLNIWQLVYDPE